MSEMTFPFRKICMSIDDVRCGTAVPGIVEIIMKYSVAHEPCLRGCCP